MKTHPPGWRDSGERSQQIANQPDKSTGALENRRCTGWEVS